jgi:hypothetical protein
MVTITGSAFTDASSVSFHLTAATSFTIDSDTQIRATVPAGAATGKINVTNPNGTGASAGDFTVIVLAPNVSLAPTSMGSLMETRTSSGTQTVTLATRVRRHSISPPSLPAGTLTDERWKLSHSRSSCAIDAAFTPTVGGPENQVTVAGTAAGSPSNAADRKQDGMSIAPVAGTLGVRRLETPALRAITVSIWAARRFVWGAAISGAGGDLPTNNCPVAQQPAGGAG